MTCLEIVGRLVAERFPLSLIYRPHKNPVFEDMMTKARKSYTSDVIDREDVRKMVRSLKNNHLIWYAPDQDFGRDNAVFVPFFSRPAATTIATARLVKMTGCAIIPISFYRLEDNQGYKLIFHKSWDQFPSGDEVQDATQVNQFVESVIQLAPEQYLWAHRRFKTRPEGEEGLYA